MTTHSKQVSAAEFKAKCLHLMNEVNEKHKIFTITKRGIPIARLVPIENTKPELFGCMQGSVTITGDIVSPIDVQWEANEP